MKFSLAAALLGHTVPALSKRHDTVVTAGDGALKLSTEILQGNAPPSIGLMDHDDARKRRGLRHHKRLMRNLASKNMALCDPKSTDPDVGILSCGADYSCEPSNTSSLGGVCTALSTSTHAVESHHHDRDAIWPVKGLLSNLRPSVATTRNECDPASIDIGILDCDEGQYCQDDEASGLGGFCVDSIDSNRRLQAYPLEYYLFLCDPPPADSGYGTCECSGLNTATGTGVIRCTENTSAADVQGCASNIVYNIYTYTFASNVLVEADDCYQTKTPTVEEICFIYDFAANSVDPPCTTEFNGQRCNSCVTDEYTTTFDCSNVPGGLSGNYFTEQLSVFSTCATSTCTNVCQASFYIPPANFATYVTILDYAFTCRSVALRAEHRVIPDADCAAYSSVAQTSCCAPMAVTVPPTTIPPTTVAPETVPPTTVAPETVPPTTVAPETVPPTTVAPETVPPTTVSPIETVPPTTVPPVVTTPPVETVPPTTVPPVATVPPTTIPPVATVPPTTVPPVATVPPTTIPPVVTNAPTVPPVDSTDDDGEEPIFMSLDDNSGRRLRGLSWNLEGW